MVASFVNLSPTQNKMIAHGTTIMPHFQGLPAVLSLVFCPKAELRTDPEKSRYTGAIVGLGAEEDSSVPIYPDDDMELVFDTTIDMDDISMINGIRMAMNLAVGSDDSTIEWGPEAIAKINDSARRKLLELVKRYRPSVEPHVFKTQYRWNMVAPEDIIVHSLHVSPNQLFELHTCVNLPKSPE